MQDKIWGKDYNFLNLGTDPRVSSSSIGVVPLLKDLLSKSQGHLSELQEKIRIDEDCPIITKINELKGRLIYKYIHDNYINHIYLWKDTIVELTISNSHLEVGGYSQNEEFMLNLRKMILEYKIEEPQISGGTIYAICKRNGGLILQDIGDAGIPLIRENYTDNVLANYDYVVRDLNSNSPSGRIVILEGEPGCGKTHILRSWLLEVPDAMFVLVSPEMVSSLGGPDLLPLLLQYKGSFSGPIVLALEDADKCLVSRDGDNINYIQALLNLGDGILGSLLDIRIIATTNANKLEMEAAILRPGRLSKRIEVDALDAKTAQKIFLRLCPNSTANINNTELDMTLAQVYALARENGWKPEARPQNNDDDEFIDDWDD